MKLDDYPPTTPAQLRDAARAWRDAANSSERVGEEYIHVTLDLAREIAKSLDEVAMELESLRAAVARNSSRSTLDIQRDEEDKHE